MPTHCEAIRIRLILLPNVTYNQRAENIRQIIELGIGIFIEIGTGHASFGQIFFECRIGIGISKMPHVLRKRKREYTHFKSSSGKHFQF